MSTDRPARRSHCAALRPQRRRLDSATIGHCDCCPADQGQELHDRRRGGCTGPDGLSLFDKLRRWEAADTATVYAFDLIQRDGEAERNRPFLDRQESRWRGY
jgi:hypothetical protein